MDNNTGHILVCIGHHPKTGALLKAAQKLAQQTGKRWAVLHVEVPETYRWGDETRSQVMRYMTMAETMGADVIQIESQNVTDAIIHYVEHRQRHHDPVDHLMLGQSTESPWWRRWQLTRCETLARRLRRYCEIHVVRLQGEDIKPSVFRRFSSWPQLTAAQLIAPLCAVAISILLAETLRAVFPESLVLDTQNISLMFLLACVVISLRYGLISGLMASALSSLTINYFYTLPYYQLYFATPTEMLNTAIFMASALVVSLVGGIARKSITHSLEREQRFQLLYRLHRKVAGAADRMETLQIIHEEIARALPMPVAFFLPPEGRPDVLELVWPQDMELSDQDIQALLKCWAEIKSTGLGTYDLTRTFWRFEPMTTPQGELGVMGVKAQLHHRFDTSFARLMPLLADQTASLIERVDFARRMDMSRFREERERLRSMLLSAVSHDLKTPLASIIGSLSVYKSMLAKERLSPEHAQVLTETALDEAQRLDSFISNILDMTRLESGDVELRKEWHDCVSLVNRVVKRLRQRLKSHEIVIQEPKEELEIELDIITAEQVVQNVLDNAAKYAPADTRIEISFRTEKARPAATPEDTATPGGLAILVRDHGKGIPDGMIEKIFDKYERLQHADSHVAGTGLGLAICRTIMQAQGGEITAANHPEGGVTFRLLFPHYRKVDKNHSRQDSQSSDAPPQRDPGAEPPASPEPTDKRSQAA